MWHCCQCSVLCCCAIEWNCNSSLTFPQHCACCQLGRIAVLCRCGLSLQMVQCGMSVCCNCECCKNGCLWPPCVEDADTIFSSCGFLYLLSSSSSFLFPHLISVVGDWMSTILLHMVWPYCEFRMQVWNMLRAACWKYRMQKIAKKSPSGHHPTTLSGYIFATKACIDNREKTC